MHRREFIVKSAAAGVIAAVPIHVHGVLSNDIGDTIQYRGLTLRWSGWMCSPDCVKLVGRWSGGIIKRYGEDWFVQASYPGEESIYRMGATHLIHVKEGQILPTLDAFIVDQKLPFKLKLDALDRVKKLIDKELG